MDALNWLQALPSGVLIALAIFDLVVRGVALWRSAKNSHKYWFIGLLVINSMGLLPLLYLGFFEKRSLKASAKK